MKTVPKWEDVTVTTATPKQVGMFMFFILYWQTCICLRVSESISLSQKGFRLGKVVISALVMHSSKSSYSTFPFLFLLHILLKPLIDVVVRNGLWNIVFLIYFAVCGGAGKRKYLKPLHFNLCLDTSIHVFVFWEYRHHEEWNYLVRLF